MSEIELRLKEIREEIEQLDIQIKEKKKKNCGCVKKLLVKMEELVKARDALSNLLSCVNI